MKTATKSSHGSWSSVIGAEPVTSFDIRLDQYGQHNYVGLSPRSSFIADGYNHGYVIQVHNGYKSSQLGKNDQHCYGAIFSPGDIVTVRVTNGNEIHFGKNGQDLGKAFMVTAPTVPLFPLVTMYSIGKVTIVD
ncbi:Aste57867_24227 [Aphanomyces stellatus]|uniref:Aste57867_24227 protein n=1 Tax=Aphanomyces stellatus TaxID=120398 RepID=A0A485LRG5_9STRA|nr:hypothetical protein As57867_024152 [Aphanomyces stellatus]VFU00868.1 Aste57867_24227 [Aphanomyces stellatus]